MQLANAVIPTELIERTEVMQLDVAATCVRIEQKLLTVAEALNLADVPFAVVKGVATAHLDYDEPSQRQFGDVDLLVHPNDFLLARSTLEEHGWVQAYPLPRFHDRFTHAVTFRRDGIVEVDLHQRIAHRALGLLIPTAELLRARVPLQLAGHELWALSAVDRLIHAAIHTLASRGPYRRLSSSADVLVLSRKLSSQAREVLSRGRVARSIVGRGGDPR